MKSFKYSVYLVKSLVTTLLFLVGFSNVAMASLIPTDLMISTSTTFDGGQNGHSFGDTSGSFSVTEGGTETSATFSGDTANPNPLTGDLLGDGDGVGFDGATNGQITNDEFAIGIDSTITLNNTSLTDIIEIIFDLSFLNTVSASGNDAYADSEFIIEQDGSEIFFSDLISDSLNGNEEDGVGLPGFGGTLTHNDDRQFTFTLNPGQIMTIDLIYTLTGGDFDSGTSESDFNQSFTINSSRVTNGSSNPNPNPIPEPNIVLLFMLAGLGLMARRRV